MEALILRRNYPVPVTFADLRRAHAILQDVGSIGERHVPTCAAEMRRAIARADRRPAAAATACVVLRDVTTRWAAALKEATGAHDDMYAICEGREVRVAITDGATVMWTGGMDPVHERATGPFRDLLETADEAGYWERPHEVRLNLQERIPTKRAICKIVERSIFEAEVRRGH